MKKILFITLLIMAGCTMPSESNFKIKVVGFPSIKFLGSYMTVNADGKSSSHTVDGVTPAEYEAKGWIISCSFQKKIEHGSLTVSIYRNGELIDQSTTTAAYGVVALATRGDSSTSASPKTDDKEKLSKKELEPPKIKKEVPFDPSRMSKEGYLDAKWGMTKQEVVDATGAEPMQNTAILETEVADTKVTILYSFIQDKLYYVAIPFKFDDDAFNVRGDMAKFSEIESLLSEKYGKPKKKIKRRNNPYIPYDIAIPLGQGSHGTLWETQDSKIILTLSGKMNKIDLLLSYESKRYAPLAEKEKRQKAKKKL